jgi:hypothetical protein
MAVLTLPFGITLTVKYGDNCTSLVFGTVICFGAN